MVGEICQASLGYMKQQVDQDLRLLFSNSSTLSKKLPDFLTSNPLPALFFAKGFPLISGCETGLPFANGLRSEKQKP